MRNTNNLYSFSWDALTIYDSASSTSSSMMGEYCGESIPPSHVSSSNEMLIHFEADFYNSNNNGFKMEYNPTGRQITPIQNNTKYHRDIRIQNFGNILSYTLFKNYID